jgi:hypothetical protein
MVTHLNATCVKSDRPSLDVFVGTSRPAAVAYIIVESEAVPQVSAQDIFAGRAAGLLTVASGAAYTALTVHRFDAMPITAGATEDPRATATIATCPLEAAGSVTVLVAAHSDHGGFSAVAAHRVSLAAACEAARAHAEACAADTHLGQLRPQLRADTGTGTSGALLVGPPQRRLSGGPSDDPAMSLSQVHFCQTHAADDCEPCWRPAHVCAD